MTRPSERRSKMVVNRPLQSRIVLSVSWPFLLALVVCAGLLCWVCIDLVQDVVEADVDLPSLVPFLVLVMALVLVCGPLLLLHLYRFSHRIAGPMVNIRRSLQAVREGRLGTRVRLRHGDFLQDTADELNAFLAWLEEHPPGGIGSPQSALAEDAPAAAPDAAEPAVTTEPRT